MRVTVSRQSSYLVIMVECIRGGEYGDITNAIATIDCQLPREQ